MVNNNNNNSNNNNNADDDNNNNNNDDDDNNSNNNNDNDNNKERKKLPFKLAGCIQRQLSIASFLLHTHSDQSCASYSSSYSPADEKKRHEANQSSNQSSKCQNSKSPRTQTAQKWSILRERKRKRSGLGLTKEIARKSSLSPKEIRKLFPTARKLEAKV